jgi:hypothetical protein
MPTKMLDCFEKIIKAGTDRERHLIRMIVECDKELSKFSRGRKARSLRTQTRHELIRQMLNAGITDAKAIRKELQQQYDINIKLKTVQNDITLIRNQKRAIP